MKTIKLAAFLMLTSVILFSCSKESTPLAIGQTYEGGIIFYLDATGQHGLIAAPNDLVYGVVWWNNTISGGSPVPSGSTSLLIGTGSANTATIISYEGFGYYAAIDCKNLHLGGYTDWYLPSLNELAQLYYAKQNLTIGNNLSMFSQYYWSSSTYPSAGKSVYVIDFTTGVEYGHDELATNVATRPIRSF